jgi:hypothetical protein
MPTRKPVNSAAPVPVKRSGVLVQFVLVLSRIKKIMKSADLPSTRYEIHHACMRCSVGLDLHACTYELASCLKGVAGSQICQSGATMPD